MFPTFFRRPTSHRAQNAGSSCELKQHQGSARQLTDSTAYAKTSSPAQATIYIQTSTPAGQCLGGRQFQKEEEWRAFFAAAVEQSKPPALELRSPTALGTPPPPPLQKTPESPRTHSCFQRSPLCFARPLRQACPSIPVAAVCARALADA
eukprot:6202909-Pleurochrysis_carterae.AAC.2